MQEFYQRGADRVPVLSEPTTPTGRAALDYAERGIPVFPLKPGEKIPFEGSRGFHDATTDADRIREWWGNCPDANVGVPTGKRSGLLVVDVDQPAGLDALEDEHGKLPATRTHATGSGGMHLLFAYPPCQEIRNSAGKLATGLDVRGEGGYIVAPPSATTRPYEVLDDLPPNELPGWLLEALTRKPEPRSGRRGDRLREATDEGGPIPVGERNWTLYRLACSFRARGADEAGMIEALEDANANRCSPPVDAGELEKIVASAARHAPGKARPATPPEVLEACERLQLDAQRASWPRMGGATDRDVFLMLLKLTRMYGTRIPAGVRVGVDMRTLALLSAVGLGSAHRAIKRLKIAGRVRTDNLDRRRKEAGAFVLVYEAREAEHSKPRYATGNATDPASVPPLAPPSAPRLRWSAPVVECLEGISFRVGTVRRLGKTAGKIVDALEVVGGTLDLADLYGRLYPHKSPDDRRRWRPRDLLRDSESYTGPLRKLVKAGVVEFRGGTVSLVADWLDALNVERENAGELEAHRRDMARYERDREAFRNRDEDPADPAPTQAEMDERRRLREGLDADGFICELVPVEDDDEEEPLLPAHNPAEEAPVLSDLAVALDYYLQRNPDDRKKTPYWLGSTLWAFDLYPGKPTIGETEAAMHELRDREMVAA